MRLALAYGEADAGSRNWLAAFFTSTSVYVLIGIAVVIISTATKKLIVPEPPPPVEVTFVEKIPRPEPPPLELEMPKPLPAPPAVRTPPRAAPAPAAAAVVPKNMKVRKLEAPPPPKELVAPDKMREAPPEEADPSEDKGIAVYGEPGTGDPAGLEGGLGIGAGSGVGGLPNGATPPRPHPSNRKPPYPRAARQAKLTGTVVLTCTVHADGRVSNVHLVQGEEPFVAAALAAVQRWRYEPALHQGHRISVTHKIEIHFKLRG